MGGAATLPQLKPQSYQTLSSHLQPHDGDRPNGGRSNPFPRGSIIEVRPDESSFKDTYFSATVISPAGSTSISPKKGSKKTSQKIHVRYKDLLASKDKSARLKEFVDVSCVRPCPPVEEIVEGFEPDDAVDALYQDGWWIGVVKRAVEGGERRYVVSFQNPTDEREFGFSELRVHWDWVDGSWVRPDRQSIAGLMFDVGRKVEVSFDQEDCQGAWFPATIQKDKGNGTYLVEYSANKNKKVVTVEATVDSLHLRPSPPLLKDKNFVLLEKVDALFDCGWWSGVIRQELENSRYLVFFKQLNRQNEFNQSELRPHMDWKEGKWFTSSQDVSTPPSESGILEHSAGENPSASVLTVSVNNLGDEKSSWGKRTRRKQRHAGGKNNSSPSYVKNSSAEVSQVENPKPNVEGTEPDVVDITAEAVQNEHTDQGLEIPVIIGLPCAEMASAGFGKSRGKRGRGSISKEITNTVTEDDSTAQNEDITLSEIVEFSEKRKRGRPRRQAPAIDDLNEKDDDPRKVPEVEAIDMEDSAVIVVETPESIVKEAQESIVMGTPEAMVMETSPRNQEKTTLNKDKPINGRSDTNDRKRTSARKHEEKVAKENSPQESLAFKRGRRRSTPTIQVQDSVGVPGSKSANSNSALQVKIVCEAPSNEFDDQPLSKWIEGMHNPSAVDSSKPSAVGQSIENGEKQRDGAIDKHQESETPSLALMDTCSAVPLEQPSLPFVKNNLLWKTIEQTMDVFQRMPQNPHFLPLQNVKECLREGFAIGHMVTFSSVVEKTCNLRIDTPQSVMDDLLETLAALETHGFNVGPIEDRVVELIALREKEAKLVDDADGLRSQQIEHEREIDKIEDEIEGITEEIRKLQEKLSVAESAKSKEKAEIAGLDAMLKETQDGIENVRREFEDIVSTPPL
ncbi:hypothetical protein PHJA_001502900 [Phtheirospermum japonicum]|uniref:Agenet domain-containing protein n=1 Tax=Phtheirospermum japonicum TaxID=374723 RepID=A0A830CED0_9LAMI|nr:hypothetical protein PHJA_001502900 [Phtheirospermum japonicum]